MRRAIWPWQRAAPTIETSFSSAGPYGSRRHGWREVRGLDGDDLLQRDVEDWRIAPAEDGREPGHPAPP